MELIAEIDVDNKNGISDADWCDVSLRGVQFTGRPTYEQWSGWIVPVAAFAESVPYIIGDWLNFGEQAFHQIYAQATIVFGEYSYGTLANYASVCRRVPFGIRSELLSFSHHSAVASLPDIEQKIKLLQRAIDEDLTATALGMLVKQVKSGADLNSEIISPSKFAVSLHRANGNLNTAIEHATTQKQREIIVMVISQLERAMDEYNKQNAIEM